MGRKENHLYFNPYGTPPTPPLTLIKPGDRFVVKRLRLSNAGTHTSQILHLEGDGNRTLRIDLSDGPWTEKKLARIGFDIEAEPGPAANR